MAVLSVICLILSGLLLALCAVVLVECVAAMSPAGSTPLAAPKSRARIAVLMPAHNEEAALPESLAAILPQMREGDRLLVVADNCTDRTAEVAARAGATVIERQDAELRGKGYALARGVDELRGDPPEIVVIVDADCRVREGCIENLAAHVVNTGRPTQAVYLMETSPQAGLKQTLSAFAFQVRGQVRGSGLARLGLPCLLGGTGMAFPWELISRARLATGNIVEDMQLALDLALAGHPATFCPHACVVSRHPDTTAAGTRQRTRWEHGHLRTLLTHVPRLIRRAVTSGRPDLLGLAMDLAVPPLSLLVLMLSVITVLALAVGLMAAGWLPLATAGVAWVLLLGAIGLAWLRFGRQTVALSTLLCAPLYALAKLPIYCRFLIRPERDWHRTQRPHEYDHAGS